VPLPVPEGYRTLDERTLPAYLAGVPAIAARLGGDASGWKAAEVGDGNVNLVFIVEGADSSVCVKQALPYVRMAGESWPLTLERAVFEYRALVEHRRHVGSLVPEVLHHDPRLYLTAVERLSPHVILRRGMIAGMRYPRLAADMADYLARSLFFTSSFGMPASEKKQLTALFCGNVELCRIMEDVFFTEPYLIHPRNQWTSPALDGLAAVVRNDAPLKIAASRLKLAFMTRAEALLHGDLHAGSIMVTPDDTRVIDQEFAFVGPMGFDIGTLLANLLVNYFSQEGHGTAANPRDEYQAWLLETTEALWSQFRDTFLALWDAQAGAEVFESALFADGPARAALAEERRSFLRGVFADALGFGGAEIFRRIFGVAHVIDLEQIEDPGRRARCETMCVRLARDLMVNTSRYREIADVTAAARRLLLEERSARPLA
jgi:5-methylthioribose kinase